MSSIFEGKICLSVCILYPIYVGAGLDFDPKAKLNG
jgi:hypothetical protein